MNQIILFILSTIGLTWILVKSPLFMAWREFLSAKNKEHDEKNWIYWFLANIHSCVGCMGFWSGLINYYALIYVPVISYAFAGSFCSLFFISLLKMIEKR